MLSESEVRALTSAYLRSVAWVDSQIGRLLEGLAETGLDDNTVVVLLSDHGFFLGEHGLVGKLQAYRANPEIEKSRLWQEAKAAILGGDVEKIYLPPGDDKTIYLELNPDPQIRRRREAETYRDLKRKISGKDK